MNTPRLFSFLAALAARNDRAWFQENKAEYDELRTEFEAEVQLLLNGLAQHDPALAGRTARKCMFRIYRDVRFSKNKDPYKTHFSAYFAPATGAGGEVPGYYLQLGPNGQTLLAGGLYQPDKTQLARLRQEIDYNGTHLRAVLQAPDFQRYFPAGLSGDKLKRPPTGYPADHPDIELLKHKGFIGSHMLLDAAVPTDLAGYALEVFGALRPLNGFLREAVGEG